MRIKFYIILAVAWFGGCGFTVPIEDEAAMTADIVGAAEVLVLFRNFAEREAVNAEFFVAEGPFSEIPANLYAPENLVMADLGVAGTGILEPFDTDALLLPCTPDLVVGTTGGTFSDNESGEERGAGQPRWVQAAAVGFCGRRVVFDYGADGDGFVTRVTVGP